MKSFHGSYDPADVTFLLKPVQIATTDVQEKERLIQSGQMHYSEMLSEEKTPDERYMNLFHRALKFNEARLARHLVVLARALAQRPGKEVVLVSLARAGTPIGVLLHRVLKALGKPSVHYSISIIRDHGVDTVALDYILKTAGHNDRDLVFVDGWTGKGAIATELNAAIAEYNNSNGTQVDSSLVVVADLCGAAGLAATSEDYLIPSSVLNSIISGLVSRTVLNKLYVGPGDFHACAFYEQKRGEDLSCYFVDRITALMKVVLTAPGQLSSTTWPYALRQNLKESSDNFMRDAMRVYGVTDRNRIKPGVGESTRALLRRVPERLVLRNPDELDVEHLLTLAKTQCVPVQIDSQLPYRAAVIIKTMGE